MFEPSKRTPTLNLIIEEAKAAGTAATIDKLTVADLLDTCQEHPAFLTDAFRLSEFARVELQDHAPIDIIRRRIRDFVARHLDEIDEDEQRATFIAGEYGLLDE